MTIVSAQKVSSQRPHLAAQAAVCDGAEDLDRLDDAELLHIVRSLPLASDRRARACELLVDRYQPLVKSCVQGYRWGPESVEDLMQVGYVGLMKAINNFDPAVGSSLAAYAQPCVAGEIKRHFRDRRWHVHVERPLKELAIEVRSASRQLAQELGRIPSDDDLAASLGTTAAEVRQARMADTALQPWSLDAPVGHEPDAATLADTLGQDDQRIEQWLNLRAVAAHWGELPWREQQILRMRFFGDMVQAEIGQQLGISQMHVSRLLAHALSYLRQRVLELDEQDLRRAARRRGRRPRAAA